MERRRQFFEFLQPSTDKFLKRLQNSYITEYIPCKAVLMEEIKYNESTIIDIVGMFEFNVYLSKCSGLSEVNG